MDKICKRNCFFLIEKKVNGMMLNISKFIMGTHTKDIILSMRFK